MSKFKWPKISKIYKITLFTFLFILLTFFVLSKEILAFNDKEKKLRKLGAENVCFTIFRIFDYFFYFFLLGTFFAPCLYCFVEKESNIYKTENRNIAFFVNKTLYIINVGYLITSGVNFINDVEFGYSLSIFIFSLLYFLISSTIYIIMSLKCKENCFPGICQWGYLKIMPSAPCWFFAPCKEKECCGKFLTEEGGCCCCCCFSCIDFFLFLFYAFVYYIGLAFYSLFWLIGKFFVYIGFSDDCWLKEDYDMDSFRITQSTLETPLDVSEEEEDKEVKKVINKIIPKKTQKKIKKVAKNVTKKIEKAEKSIEESES